MKRRSFLMAVLGAAAAVSAPIVNARPVARLCSWCGFSWVVSHKLTARREDYDNEWGVGLDVQLSGGERWRDAVPVPDASLTEAEARHVAEPILWQRFRRWRAA